MGYRSILVNLDIDRPIAPITNAAIDLAARSGARLIGLCAAGAALPMIMPATGYVATEAGNRSARILKSVSNRFVPNFTA